MSAVKNHLTNYQEEIKKAWTPEQVPIGALFRLYGDKNQQYVIVAVAPNISNLGPALIYRKCIDSLSYCFLPDLATCIEPSLHSIDNGKTWLPCHN